MGWLSTKYEYHANIRQRKLQIIVEDGSSDTVHVAPRTEYCDLNSNENGIPLYSIKYHVLSILRNKY